MNNQIQCLVCNNLSVNSNQAPLSMEFSRQEYWSEQPFHSLGTLPDPGIKPGSCALQADSLPSESLGKPHYYFKLYASKYIHTYIHIRYSLEGLMLKLQYCGHLMRRDDSLKETLMLRKIEGKRGRGSAEDEMVRKHHQLNGQEFEQIPGDCEGWGAWCAAVHGVSKSQT